MTQRDNASIATLTIFAALAGAAAALLLAPRKGRETRDQLKDSFHEMNRQSNNEVAAAREQLDASIDHAKDMSQRLRDAIKTRVKPTHDLDKQLPATSSWQEEES